MQAAPDIEDSQIQPASLDLRLGAKAYRVRASFLPGRDKTVEEQLDELKDDEINIEHGAVLEKGCVYVVELLEHLNLPESISGLANPKSSTGRLDIFTRLIADRSDVFDSVHGKYEGKIYAEISPCSFSIRVRKGSRLNQMRFRRRTSRAEREQQVQPERPRPAQAPRGTAAGRRRHPVAQRPDPERRSRRRTGDNELIGYRAQRYSGVVDVDAIGKYDARDFWEPMHVRADQKLDPRSASVLHPRLARARAASRPTSPPRWCRSIR